MRAARGFESGTINLQGFAKLTNWAIEILGHPREIDALIKTFETGPSFHDLLPPLPLPDIGGGLLWPRRPPFTQWLDPANQAWLQCAFNFNEELKPLPNLPETSPPHGITEPSVICANQAAGTFTFSLSSPNIGFGKQENWTLSVGDRPATITNWTNHLIEAEVSGVQPGCAQIKWGWSTSWAPPIGAFDACREALRIPIVNPSRAIEALLSGRTKLWQPAGEMTVLGPDILQFSADGVTAGSSIEREACTVVTLAWQVNPRVCQGRESLITVALLRDGTVLQSNLPFSGTIDEQLTDTARYVLRVEARNLNGSVCSTHETLPINVTRFRRIILELPEEVTANQSGTGRVTVSCNATSANNIDVALSATPANGIVIPPVVTIPAGNREAIFTVLSGTQCGQVDVTASAQNHRPGNDSTCVLLPPNIVSITPNTSQPACVGTRLTIEAGCISSPPVLRITAIDSTGQRVNGRVSVAAGTTPCVRTTRATVDFPPMKPGTYTIEVTDRGGTTQATQSLVINPNPQIDSNQPEMDVTAACPPPTKRVSVSAIGADSVNFTYLGITKTDRPSSSNPGCSRWTATVEFDFSRSGDIEVTPYLGSVAGPAKTIRANLIFSDKHIVTAVILRGVDSSGQGRTADVEKGITTQNGTTWSSAGTLAEQQERRFPIDECVYTRFRVTRDGSSTETGDYVGHPEAEDSEVMGM